MSCNETSQHVRRILGGIKMRIFNVNERLHTNLDTINYYFMNEFNYYSQHNVRKFEFNGVEYASLYRRLNIQLVVTNKCPFKCAFCIEKINPTNESKENFLPESQITNLKSLLLSMKKVGMEPTVSITGGEPTIYFNHIIEVAKMLDEIGIKYNLNTSGNLKAKVISETFDRINLSVHEADCMKNSDVFGVKRNEYWKEEAYQNATIQRVITSGNFDNLISFLDSFNQKRFSIRFVARTVNETSFDWKPLFDQITKDNRFQFIQQKIGDYYFFEEYKFKGEKTIRFSFADMVQLAYYKQQIEKDENFVRAVVVMADGSVKFDWIDGNI